MKKIFLTLILVSISIFTLHSGDHQDIAFSFSPSSTYGYYGPFGVEDSLRLDLSMSLGISSRFEAGLGIITELTPDIVDENTIYFEVLYSIIGPRSTASKVAGTGINTLIGIGGFYSHVFSNGRISSITGLFSLSRLSDSISMFVAHTGITTDCSRVPLSC